MSSFGRLDPALQHHIVNSLGWRQLRSLQEAAIEPILAGEHALLLAPTAGGKTEAVAFPVLSRMVAEHWQGLSVLYVCPIKALLNNLEPRLHQYAQYLGRRVALWHGDVSSSARNRILKEPPEILLTTPESLEVMLASPRVEEKTLLGNVRVAVVDELHAFAGDDRGWHLLAVLERIDNLLAQPMQRVGLSATIGNPEELLKWLTVSRSEPQQVIAPSVEGIDTEAEIILDHVGSLENAATVISRLYRGEKRLVFVDSRARVEQLAATLRDLGARTFVSHSSVSVDERRQAEQAFAQERDAVIVATSTLELGIDVGDLDRVIQLDAPATVASFLQRLGRTGRRAGSSRNCLLLTTNSDALLQAAGLLLLWSRGWVEPVIPPAKPYHIAAQQLLAQCLQKGHLVRAEAFHSVTQTLSQADITAETLEQLINHAVHEDILIEDYGLLSIGRTGEELFGFRHFMELMSVFASDPLFTIRHGRDDLGQVHPVSFGGRGQEPAVLLLAGRSWRVRSVDWDKRIAWVEPAAEQGRSQWMGSPRALGYELCQAVLEVLTGNDPPVDISRRAKLGLSEARAERPWFEMGRTVIERDGKNWRWWTFAGMRANAALARALPWIASETVDNYSLRLKERVPEDVGGRLSMLEGGDDVGIEEERMRAVKFSEVLPVELARELVMLRNLDVFRASEIVTGSKIEV